MAVLPQATPLLLTKRLNAFLNANQTPQLPTLLLTTYHGKLLAHASSLQPQLPVSVLRTHATVAASLLAIHTSSSVALPSALPGSATPDPTGRLDAADDGEEGDAAAADDDDDDEQTARGTDDESEQQQQQQQRGEVGRASAAVTAPGASVKPVMITVQLSGGTIIIRRLKCGLLLVCVGPSTHSDSAQSATSSPSGGPATAPAASTTAAAASAAGGSGGGGSGGGGGDSGVAAVTQALESADLLHTAAAVSAETESLASAGATTTTTTTTSGSIDSSSGGSSTSVVTMRRRAAELARWLDEKLGTLSIPDDSTRAE